MHICKVASGCEAISIDNFFHLLFCLFVCLSVCLSLLHFLETIFNLLCFRPKLSCILRLLLTLKNALPLQKFLSGL